MAGMLTLAIIKPHMVMDRKVGAIISEIEDQGYAIILAKMVEIRPEGVDEFYKEHVGKPFFMGLKASITMGPVWVMVLAKENAVEEWRKTIGATNSAEAEAGTIRHRFGDRLNVASNAVHGSATDHDAKREINFFFSREIKLAEKVQALDNQHAIA